MDSDQAPPIDPATEAYIRQVVRAMLPEIIAAVAAALRAELLAPDRARLSELRQT